MQAIADLINVTLIFLLLSFFVAFLGAFLTSVTTSVVLGSTAFLAVVALAVVVLANVMESDVWIEDASIASIFMQLQAEDLGLGSCWCQIRNRQTEQEEDASQYIRGLLNIPYQLEVLSIIGFGYKEQPSKPFDESRLQWEKIHLGTYQLPDEKQEKDEA